MNSGRKEALAVVLFGEQHVARVLQRARNGALMLRGKMGVFARQDLAGVGHEMAHDFRRSERDLGRGEGLRGGFGGAHGFKWKGEGRREEEVVNGAFLDGNKTVLGGISPRQTSP